MINWQLSKQGIRWPVSPDRTAGSSVDPSRSIIFFEVIRWQITSLKWSQAQVYFSNDSHEICWAPGCVMSLWPRTIKILFSNWPRTQNFSQFYKNTGREDLFLSWSRVGHALRPIFMLWLVKIWQVSSCGKVVQHLESCLLWQLVLKLTEFCVNLQGHPTGNFEKKT